MRGLLAGLLILLCSPALAQQQTPPVIAFDSVPNPLKLPENMYLGEVSGIAVNSKGHVFVLSRGNTTGPAYAAAATQLLEFDAAGKYLREIGLTQVMLLHKKSKNGGRLGVGDLDIAFFVVAHEECHDVEQAHQGVSLSVTDLIKKLVHEIDHGPIVPLVFYRAKFHRRSGLNFAPSRCEGVQVVACCSCHHLCLFGRFRLCISSDHLSYSE